MFIQSVLCISLFAALFSTATSQTVDDYRYKVVLQNVAIDSIICAGALVEDDIVLTAGECINKFSDKANIKILAGVFSTGNGIAWSVESKIAKITLHTSFVPNSIAENIALLKLDAPLTGSVNVAPVELAEKEADVGSMCYTSYTSGGWFNRYNLPVQEKQLCADSLSEFVDKHLICTGWNAEYAPQTELGGPLVCNGKLQGIAINDRWVPSYEKYGAFLSLTTIKDWIEMNKFEGTFVDEDEYPYLVQFVDPILREKDSLSYICAGVLISEDTVLTTAECAQSGAIDYVAVVGSTRRMKYFDTTYVTRERISSVRRHENYNANTKEFNIGLITLENPLAGAKFPSLKRIKSERLCQAVGWGPQATSQYAYNETDLLTVNLKLNDPALCTAMYKGLKEESILCSGDVKEKRNFCQNDLGGPLFCGDVLRGLYSSGDSCSKGPEYPAVYTDVVDYIEWIEGRNNSGRFGASLICIFIALFNIFA